MNDNPPVSSSPAEPIELAARQWFVRLRSDHDLETRSRFEAWLAEDAAHAAAYAKMERLFREADILKGSSIFGTNRTQSPATSHRIKFWIAGMVAVAATLMMTVMPDWMRQPLPSSSLPPQQNASLSAKRGEIRTVNLADGSKLTLDTDSQIYVSLDRLERRLKLVKGHARLAVAKDPRPFRVDAGAGSISAAQGNEATFDIAYDDGSHVEVAMISGHAQARALLQTAVWRVPIVALGAGETFDWSEAGASTILPAAAQKPIDASQWPSGWVSYNSVALAKLVAQANRYTDRPIVIDSATVGQMAITGRFHISEPAPLAGRLADVFDLRLVEKPDALHLRQK